MSPNFLDRKGVSHRVISIALITAGERCSSRLFRHRLNDQVASSSFAARL